jgi:hypothetical protein
VQGQKNSGNNRSANEAIAHALGWPLRKALSFSLEHPSLLEAGTRAVSRFPPLFNWLLGFAQSHGIVMAEEEPAPVHEQIQSLSELGPGAQQIYKALKAEFNQSHRKKP